MDGTSLVCGIGIIRATWMNQFATVKSFITVYSILGMIQSMSYVYFTITLTTLEKRFKIPGKTLGIVLSGNEVSQILLSLFLSYYGGNKNRPKWIAVGTLSSALSCFVLALPHFLYGAGEDAMRLTYQYINETGEYETVISKLIKRDDPILHCQANKPPQECQLNDYTSDYSILPLVLIFISQFILGIGTTLFYVLGQTYIDDNTKKTDSPKLLGISMALRMIGPMFGFLLGFVCLRLYIDPTLDPIIKKDDPRWMGAWWIGWIICGSCMTVIALILAMFPKQLPKKYDEEIKGIDVLPTEIDPLTITEEKKVEIIEETSQINGDIVLENIPEDSVNFKDFPQAIRRLLRNKLLMNNIFSSVFAILGASGFITYFIKYVEIQFQRSSARESIVAGPVILSGSVIGLMASGIIISKYRPQPKYLLMWNVLVGLLFMGGQFSFVFLGCENYNLQNYSNISNVIDLNAQCNVGCDCGSVKFSPVCYQPERITYFSPCHAGCTAVINSKKDYTNCSCLPETSDLDPESSILKNGFCYSNCSGTYYIFILVMAVVHFSGSSGRIGNMLVNYRAVDVKDKAFAQGFALWIISVFALIPGPIIYGWIYDNSCLIWDRRCSHQGNCWYYEKDKLRWTLNMTGLFFTGIAVFFDFLVWKQGKDLNLYSDNEFFPDNSKNSAEERGSKQG